MNIKYRVKFEKGEGVKYVSHLDIMRAFQRALKRAGVPVAYSQGFNPHQLLSFAHPLSLGYTSEGEYGDFEVQSFMEPEDMKQRLNDTLPIGLHIKEVVVLKEKTLNAMASVEGAEFEATLDVAIENLEEKIKEFMAQDEIIAFKKTKNTKKEVNIKPDIYKLSLSEDGGDSKLFMFLAAGSTNNIRADLVVESFYNFLGIEFDKFKIRFCRKDMFRKENDQFYRLNVGVENNETDFN